MGASTLHFVGQTGRTDRRTDGGKETKGDGRGKASQTKEPYRGTDGETDESMDGRSQGQTAGRTEGKKELLDERDWQKNKWKDERWEGWI